MFTAPCILVLCMLGLLGLLFLAAGLGAGFPPALL